MKQLLEHLKYIKKPVIAAMVFAVLSQISNLTLPMLMSSIINNGIANEDIDYIKKVGLLMMCISALGVVIAVGNSYFSSKTSALYGKRLRREIFLKVEDLSQRDIDKVGTPSLITRCTNDVRVIQDFVLTSLRMIISVPIMLVGGVVMSFILNPKLATIIFAVIPIIGVIAALVIRFVIPIFRKRQKLVDSVNRFIREKLSGIRVIRAFNRTEKEDARFDERNEALSGLTLKFQRMMAVLIPICIVLIIIALDLLILVAANNFNSMDPVTEADKLLSAIGDLQAFVIYMIMIVSAVTMTAAMFVIVPRAKISANRITEVLNIVPSVVDPEKAEKVDESLRGTVEFRSVSFGYNEAENYVLSDISFTAEKGKVTAFIGSTGSGKSTIANLIMRFYDVNKGQILVTIPEMSNLIVEFDLPEEYRSKVNVGDTAVISPDSLVGTKFTGKVMSIATLPVNMVSWDSASPKVYKAKLQFDKQSPLLVNGMSVQINIITKIIPKTLFVPVEAVFEDNDRFYVYKHTLGGVKEQDVKLGESNDNFVQITEGIEENDIVYLYRPYQKKQDKQ